MTANLVSILLQAPGGGGGFQLLFLGGMVVVMYFFMIRPQAKRAKEQKKFASSISEGERVITSAGIHGTIKRANDNGTLQLEVAHGTFITVERTAISMEMTNAFLKRTEVKPVVEAKK